MDAVIKILTEAVASKLYTSLIVQLNKDFKRAGLDDEFDADNAPEVLKRNLTAGLYALIISNFEGYLNLLYAIDVSEAKIKALPDMKVHELAEAVTLLILEREFLKVSLKNKLL